MVKNYMEDVVYDLVNKLWKEDDIVICRCDKCKKDVIALSLNAVKPKYFSSNEGKIWAKIICQDPQKITDVMSAVAEAIDIVSKNKRHD